MKAETPRAKRAYRPSRSLHTLPYILVPAILSIAVAADARLADDVELVNVQVLSETPLDPTTTVLELTADVVNTDVGTYSDVAFAWLDTPGTWPDVTAPDGRLDFGPIGPSGSGPASDTATLHVPNDRVADLLAALAVGPAGFESISEEETVYVVPLTFVDEETDTLLDGAASGTQTLVFAGWTTLLQSLSTGDIVAVDPDGAGFEPLNIALTVFPFEVLSITEIDGAVHVDYQTITNLDDLVVSGTVSQSIEPRDGVESTRSPDALALLINSCPEGEICRLPGLPVRFNEVELVPGVFINGEIILRSSGLVVDLKLRDGGLRESRVGFDIIWTANLELRSERHVEIADITQEILQITSPPIYVNIFGFPLGVSLDFDISVGATVDLTAGVVLSAHHQATTTVAINWNDGGAAALEVEDPFPGELELSSPQLTDNTALDARVWTTVDATVLFGEPPIVSAGPGITTTAYADLQVAPDANPWWSMGVGVEQAAAFELNILGIEIPIVEPPLWETYRTVLQAPTTKNDVRTSGESVRWGLGLADLGYNPFGQTATHLANGDLLVTANPGASSYLSRIDPTGQVLWTKDLIFAKIVRAFEMDDGRLALLGTKDGGVWMSFHDSTGTTVSSSAFATDESCDLEDAAMVRDALGNEAFIAAGTTGNPFDYDPCAVRFDNLGSLTWAFKYDSAEIDAVHAVAADGAGGAVLAGETGTDVLDIGGQNGLVMRIDADGNQLWGTAIANRVGGVLRGVGVADDGTILVSGNSFRSIVDAFPAFWLIQLSPDGDHLAQVSIRRDAAWETEYANLDNGIITQGGDTPYDVGWNVEPLPGGGWLVAGSSGLNDWSEAWLARLSPGLGVEWHTVFDGPYWDMFFDVELRPDAIAAVGHSRSANPADPVTMVLNLPLEGLVRFDDGVNLVSRYMQPDVYPNLIDDNFFTTDPLGAPVVASPVGYQKMTLITSAGTPPPDATPATASIIPLATPFHGFPPDGSIFSDGFEDGTTSAWQ